jgi:hypothetical protein
MGMWWNRETLLFIEESASCAIATRDRICRALEANTMLNPSRLIAIATLTIVAVWGFPAYAVIHCGDSQDCAVGDYCKHEKPDDEGVCVHSPRSARSIIRCGDSQDCPPRYHCKYRHPQDASGVCVGASTRKRIR